MRVRLNAGVREYLDHVKAWGIVIGAGVALVAPALVLVATGNAWWLAPYALIIPAVGAFFTWLRDY